MDIERSDVRGGNLGSGWKEAEQGSTVAIASFDNTNGAQINVLMGCFLASAIASSSKAKRPISCLASVASATISFSLTAACAVPNTPLVALESK